jgi:hypothetical protein
MTPVMPRSSTEIWRLELTSVDAVPQLNSDLGFPLMIVCPIYSQTTWLAPVKAVRTSHVQPKMRRT